MRINVVLGDRIIELSETKNRFEKIKNIFYDWRKISAIVIVAITTKVAIEQIVMALRG